MKVLILHYQQKNNFDILFKSLLMIYQIFWINVCKHEKY